MSRPCTPRPIPANCRRPRSTWSSSATSITTSSFPQKTLASLHAALKPGGRLVVVDYRREKGKGPEWIFKHVRAGKEVFTREIEAAGFKLQSEEKFLKDNYMIEFRAGRAESESAATPSPLGYQPRHPPDPGRVVLHLPRTGCRPAEGRFASGPAGNRRQGSDRSGQGGRESARATHHQQRSRRADAAAAVQAAATAAGGRGQAPPLDRRGSEVRNPLGLHPAHAAAAARRFRTKLRSAATGPAIRSTISSPRGTSQQDLQPSPDADPHTLLRRLRFDLTGLPPSLEETDAFAADHSPAAYERAVDRLLASPQFGERMAMYWLDVVRYADSGGYHSDNERSVWLFRDYVVQAFNDNRPFDRFTIEQLAGDLLPGAAREQKIASGYNRLLQTTEEGGAQAKEYTAKYAADRVRNTAAAWLGSTMACCQCHDHKYDPFTMKDFYSFGAFFADVREEPISRQEQTPMPTPEQEARLKQLDAEIALLAKQKPAAKKVEELKRQKAQLQAEIPTTLITQAVPPRTMRILPRGNWQDDSGPVVEPAIPEFLGKIDVKDRRATRLDLARWMVSRENPLVARVLVNRLWMLLFGQGLVRTCGDLGTQGALPSHPELLDWLAVELIDSGWNVKHVMKLMVMSRTYQQTSRSNPDLDRRDPTNTWLARQGRFRLDAEMVRDNALAVSGLLSPRIGGPTVKPYQPAGYWDFLNFPKRQWQDDHGESQYRRGLYTFWQRTFLHPSLLAFDASTREECTVDRPRSNTPLQALALLNDPTYVEASKVFAGRIVREGGRTEAERLRYAYRRAIQREPTAAEAELLTRLYRQHLAQYQADRAAAAALLKVGDAQPPDGVATGRVGRLDLGGPGRAEFA